MSGRADGHMSKFFSVTLVLTAITIPEVLTTDHRRTVNDRCGNVRLTAEDEPHYITSPGFPNHYRDGLACKWTVTSHTILNIYIHQLNTEGGYDFLTIYNGPTESDRILARLDGNSHSLPQRITPTSKDVLIKFTTDGSGTRPGFELSYVEIRGTPLLSESVTVTDMVGMVEISMDFLSFPPYQLVHWRKNDVLIQEDEKHNLTVIPVRTSNVLSYNGVDGFRTKLSIKDPELQDFGMYRVTIGNAEGLSERTVFVKKTTSAPTLQNYIVLSQDATILVKFTSDTNFTVNWYQTERFVNDERSDVVIITQQDKSQPDPTYTTMLKHGNPTQPDFGNYTCVIRNEGGSTEVFIKMEYPESELPHLLLTSVQMIEQRIVLTANFDSNLAYPTAMWYHKSTELRTSDKYHMEIKWNETSRHDWLLNNYPHQHSRVTEHIMNRNNPDQQNVDVHYNFPSIGGSRSSTQTNANYTAVLTIHNMTLEDLGVYQIVLDNGAGISSHEIDVTGPEVFFNHMCNQEDTVQLVCHVVSCSSISQTWTHSMNGMIIRTLQGHQNGTTNTLTIPACMFSDAGTYTCVAVEEETGRDVTMHQNTTTLTVTAVPVILPPNVTIQSDRIEVEVPFYSYPSYYRVTWQINGQEIDQTGSTTINTVEPRAVNLPIHGKKIQQDGYGAKIIIPDPPAEMFGTYKITVQNDVGISERLIEATNPDYIKPVISHIAGAVYVGNVARLNVTFYSYFPYISVKWQFRGQEIQISNRYSIQTEPSWIEPDSLVVRDLVRKTSVLTVRNVTEEDYGKYQVTVTNEVGKAEVPVFLREQEYGVPILVGELGTNKVGTSAEIFASFYSYPNYSDIKWLRNGAEISTEPTKYSIFNKEILLQISSNGETVSRNGTKTTLRVEALDKYDSGLYTLQINNEAGMIGRSVALEYCNMT